MGWVIDPGNSPQFTASEETTTFALQPQGIEFRQLPNEKGMNSPQKCPERRAVNQHHDFIPGRPSLDFSPTELGESKFSSS